MKNLLTFLLTALLAFSVGWAANVYVKVENTSQLEVGKTYILVYENGNSSACMGSISSGYGSAIQNMALSNKTIDIEGKSVLELTLDGSTNAWTFHTGSGYLASTTDKNISVQQNVSEYTKWTISANFTLVLTQNSERKIQYNSSSPRFTTYRTSQKAAYLYVKQSTVTTPTLTVSETDLTLPDIPVNESSTSGQFNVSGSNLTGNVTLTRTSGSSDFSLSTSSIAPSNGSVNQNVTVTYSGTSTTETSATFSISSPGATTQYITVTAKKATGGGGSDSNAFTLVTDASNLEDGEYVLVYSSGTNYALSNAWNSGYYSATSSNFTLSNNVVTLSTGNSVNILTLIKTGNSYYIKDADGYYVGYGSSTNLAHDNSFNSISNSNSYKWNISIASNGNATITNVGTNSRVIRLRESGHDRWAAYSTSNTTGYLDGRLYKRDTNNPRLTVSDDSIDLGTITGGAQSVSGSFTLTGANLTAGVQLSSSNNDFSVSPTTINDANGENTITVTYNGNNATTATATILIESVSDEASSVNVTVTAKRDQVATPTFSPDASVAYTSAQTVTISCATEGATIHYTYNGGPEQTGTSPITLYVNSTATIEAYATLAGYVDSETATATYTIDLTPTLTVNPTELSFGTIAGDQLMVTTTNLTAGVNASVLNTDYSSNTDKWTVNPNTLGTDGGTMTVNYGGRLMKSDNTVRVSTTTNGVADVDVPVHYKHSGPIYIVSSPNWDFSDGIEMNHSGDVYSYTLNATTETYLVFTKKVGNDVDWNSGHLFGPVASGDWWLTEESMDTDFAIDSTAYHVVKMHNGTYTITLNAATNKMRIVADVHAPVFSHEGGRYYDPIDVEITSDTYGAHIYYTLDGSEPSANNGTLYTGPVTISDESTTLKAVAIYGDVTSPVTSATYTIKPQGSDEFELVTDEDNIMAGEEYVLLYISGKGKKYAMTENHNGSQYASTDEGFTINASVVTLEDPTSVNVLTLKNAGNSLFYIQDQNGKYLYLGSNSNVVNISDNYTDNAQYKWSITLSGDSAAVITNTSQPDTRYLQCNASASAYACYKSSSNLYNASLYMRSAVKVPAPQITPAGGTSNKRFESVEVTITAADGCRIYYTTDGTAPSVNSTEYTGVFVLPYGSAPTTVKAIAVDGEGKVSRVTTVVYYWDRVQVSISPASKEVVGNVDVTITPSPSDATVTYTINGGEPQTYNGQFTVQVNEENTPVTVEATAVKGESTATASVTYTYKDGGVNSIAEFLALDNNEERFFKNPVVVLFDYSQNGDQDYIWVKDRTGYMKLFIQPGFDEITSKPRYNNGDVIPEGFTVKKITYTEHDASFIEGKSDDPSLENFKTPKERALADPEQVKLSELLANPGYYNDRYLYINKLEITGHGGTNYYVASDENNDNISEVSGNNVIIYNKFPTWNEKDGTSHTVTIPSADGKYYNVKFIFQKYGSVYEIMPIEFTPWEENKVRLEDLVKIEVSTPYKEYTISNDLIATKVTWDDNKGKFAIFAKDDEAYASPRHRLDGQESYFIRYENVDHPELNNTVMQEDYDQSNWVEILIPSAIDRKLDDGYQSQLDEFKSQFENKILPGGSIRGTYIDKLNPTIEYNLNLSELPSNLAKSAYKPNIYTPVNFLMENLDDEGSEAGAKSYRTDALGNQYFFMMDAKPHETCMVVWGYYPGDGDYFYIPERIGDQVNGHQFHGIFKADMSLCEDPNVSTANGSTVKSCFPEASDVNGADMEHVKLFGFDAIVRKNPDYNWNGSNGAPRRVDVAPYTEGQENVPAYIVYPLNAAENASGIVTSVEELNVLMKAVESVRYYNIMGMESEKPFEGINIVVTRYTDGSTSTAKILR